MLPAVICRRPTPAISALIKLATKTTELQRRYSGDFRKSIPHVHDPKLKPVTKGGVTFYAFTPVIPLDPPNPIVSISVWDPVVRCWIPCETDGITLKMGNRRLLLEKDVEYKNMLAPVCGIEWRLKEKEILPAFLENIYEYPSSAMYIHDEIPSPLHPILYFGLHRRGQVTRVRNEDLPSEHRAVADATLASLLGVRKKIEEMFAAVIYSDAVWIRLECPEPLEKSRAVEILLGTYEKRFQVLTELALPCRGKTPFLQSTGRFDVSPRYGRRRGGGGGARIDERRGQGKEDFGEALVREWDNGDGDQRVPSRRPTPRKTYFPNRNPWE
ncbi:hypothetical protein TWF569_008963 [Orbilia oligospora]|uniref:Uncharacterized protein n=1 Tax=Orbilia oligospora TaxID=2813651 RepID=A0A7C8N5R4_ORBOL|nr:hypothetical protein TWF102_010557 [Orbilia oligospora]KAF3097935.1 hypothetical protein TWF706_006884 [Orbilia oligospora]KAF3105837.1 hypothetical protein TWF103_006536 [Orbilia oligospora]KAF3145395.1 hypothetical protein TWF594_004338 [Orbilia oligospora]KAF3155594.1 hypothetical protein TWF569_008963 [Orbilia oligospora]